MKHRTLKSILLIFALTALAAAQDIASFEKRITVKKLPNGLTIVICERPEAPVFSFYTMVDAGSVQDPMGATGLAHMFEHMAFKGTETIGTTDYAQEKKAIAAMETAYQEYQAARLAPKADPKRVEELFKAFKAREEESGKFLVKNEFDDIVTREGGVGLNAFTSADETGFFYSLPANKTELFAYLESERFYRPVFREFYKERDVVFEERRERTESTPIGRLVEQFVAASFNAHTYHQPTIGYAADLQSFTLTDAETFFRANYAPANLITSIVGDIKPQELIPLLERYFGRIPARPKPQPLRTVEPPQVAEKTVVIEDPAQPFYLEAYHKPASTDPDQAVYEAIDDILSGGRTSRFYRALVRDQRIAVQVQSFSGFPGQKYPNLWAVLAVPGVGKTDEEVQAAIHKEIERLQKEDVSDEELARFKTRAKAKLVRSLRDNQGIANQIAEYQRLYGDWRELFRETDRLDRVTKADIRRVANQAFQKSNRTVTMITNARSADASASPASPTSKQPGSR
jgi:predicted Zn-dependent peptidase